MQYLKDLLQKYSLKQKIMAFTIGSVVLSTVILIFAMSSLSQQAILEQVNSNLHAISSAKSADVSETFIQFAKNMGALSNSKFIQDALVSYESVAFSTGLELGEDADIAGSTYFKNIQAKYNENFQDFLRSYPLNSFALVLNNGFTIAQVG